jgi:hypothetical protein
MSYFKSQVNKIACIRYSLSGYLTGIFDGHPAKGRPPQYFLRVMLFNLAVKEYHMNDDADLRARWNMARHDLLNMLLEFHNHWNTAFHASHNCGHTKTPDLEKCMASIEKAWADIDDMDDMIRRYRITIGKMRDIARKMYEARQRQRPG